MILLIMLLQISPIQSLMINYYISLSSLFFIYFQNFVFCVLTSSIIILFYISFHLLCFVFPGFYIELFGCLSVFVSLCAFYCVYCLSLSRYCDVVLQCIVFVCAVYLHLLVHKSVTPFLLY